jgi:hypothetical protein
MELFEHFGKYLRFGTNKHSMEVNPSLESSNYTVTQIFLYILWNLKVHEPVQANPCYTTLFLYDLELRKIQTRDAYEIRNTQRV